jgi:hypothetical protein
LKLRETGHEILAAGEVKIGGTDWFWLKLESSKSKRKAKHADKADEWMQRAEL